MLAQRAGDGEGRGDVWVAERRRKVETSRDCRAAGELGERCRRRVGKLKMDEYKANLKQNECGAVETV